MTRVLVYGGRTFKDRDAIMRALRPYENKRPTDPSPHKIIAGGAPGVDTLAEEWARCFGVPVRVFLANWPRHGKSAVLIRNQRMLSEGRPDVVVAFAKQRGVADLKRRAQAEGIEIVEITS